LNQLDQLPEDSELLLDARKTIYLDNDILEILDDCAIKAKNRNIKIKRRTDKREF
jgi:hypothetical protein